MSTSNSLNPDLNALQADLAALRDDVSDIMSHLKSGVSNGAESAVSQIDETARKVVSAVAKDGQQSLKWVSDGIEARPVLSLLIALGLGYVGGRLLMWPAQTAR